MRRRNIVINSALGAAVVAVGVVCYFTLGTSSTASAAARTTTVRTATVTASVSASGNVSSATTTNVAFADCTGKLIQVAVQPGQAVTAGQLLGKLDPTTAATAAANAQSQLAIAQASAANAVSSAQTSLSNAQGSYNLDVSQANSNIATTRASIAADEAVPSTSPGYQAAQSQLTKDNQTLSQQLQQLASTKLKDQQQINSAQTQLNQAQSPNSSAQANVATATANLATANKTLSECSLTAPVAGTVTAVNGTVGSTPGSSSSSSSSSSGSGSGAGSGSGSGSSSGSSSAFVTLVDMSHLVIDASFSESDINSVRVGQDASILFSAVTDTTHPNGTTVSGKVSSIDVTSTVSSNVVNYGVTISLVSPPATIRLGQSGTITVVTASKSDVLAVSTSALTTLGTATTATVQEGKTQRVVPVQVGIAGGGLTEIVSGLSAGQTVVIPTTTGSTSTTGGFPGANLRGGGLTGGLGTGGR